jgi:hypothetical protein
VVGIDETNVQAVLVQCLHGFGELLCMTSPKDENESLLLLLSLLRLGLQNDLDDLLDDGLPPGKMTLQVNLILGCGGETGIEPAYTLRQHYGRKQTVSHRTNIEWPRQDVRESNQSGGSTLRIRERHRQSGIHGKR